MIKTLAMIATIISLLIAGETDVLVAIATKAQEHDVPIVLAFRQIYAESSFDPEAVSPNGKCHGLGQLHEDFWELEDPYDPEENLDVAFGFMKFLSEKYEDDYRKALCGYNWGPGNLDRCLEGHGEEWWEQVPKVTRKYVDWIMGGYDGAKAIVSDDAAGRQD